VRAHPRTPTKFKLKVYYDLEEGGQFSLFLCKEVEQKRRSILHDTKCASVVEYKKVRTCFAVAGPDASKEGRMSHTLQ